MCAKYMSSRTYRPLCAGMNVPGYQDKVVHISLLLLQCWDSNSKDGFPWYKYQNMSGMALFSSSICLRVCVFMCFALQNIWYLCEQICHIILDYTKLHTSKFAHLCFFFFPYLWCPQVTHRHTQMCTLSASSNRYPIAGSCGRVPLYLSALPGKGAASSDAITTNSCIKRFSVLTIPPTFEAGRVAQSAGQNNKKEGRDAEERRQAGDR